MRIIILPLSLLWSIALQAGALQIPGVQVHVDILEGLIASRGRIELPRLYPATYCMDLSLLDKRGVGSLCLSSDAEALKSLGVGRSSESTFEIATGMAIYPLRLRSSKPFKLYVADTDCDDENGAIYRATATCLVVYAPMRSGAFLHGNFVLRNHVQRKLVVRRPDIDALLGSVRVTVTPSGERSQKRR